MLPTLHDLRGVAGVAVALLLFATLGRAATSRRILPELQLVAGWGLACLVLTVWGVLTPWPLQFPAVALGVAGIAGLAWRGWPEIDRGAWRLLVLTLPLWMVMLSARPSQIDTWLNLLPNAAYLFDHGLLPTAQRPESYSFLPVAPYNSQFTAYIASLASGAFADGAMGLFNIALLCASGLLLARVVGGKEGPLPWCACALGLLLAVPLNPGFVPRFFFSPYGEPSLAVTTLFAVWLAADMLAELADGVAWPKASVALALVLAALVNIKQSGIGLLLPVVASMLVLAMADPRTRSRRALVAILVVTGPALALYLLWQRFAIASFADGELKPLPFAEWNVALIPQILWGMAVEMVHKATFFLFIVAVLVFAAVRLRRDAWSRERNLFGLIAGVILLFNGFLLFTYVAHFPPAWAVAAHSYARYEAQISLLVMLGLAVALRPYVARRMPANGGRGRYAGIVAVAAILVLPIVGMRMLRFDLDFPQPELWQLGHAVAEQLQSGDRLALVLPGDTDNSVGSMLRGVMLFTPPRRPGLDFHMATGSVASGLRDAMNAGYQLALVSCTPPGLVGVPAGVATLMRNTPEGWRAVLAWPWPSSITTRRFAALLARAPLCAAPPPQ